MFGHPLASRLTAIENRLTAIEATLTGVSTTLKTNFNLILKGLNTMALDITNLQNAVAAETTVEKSAITLISGLAKQIQDLITASGNTVDPVALQAIVDKMTASQTALAAAVTANTPAAPPAA